MRLREAAGEHRVGAVRSDPDDAAAGRRSILAYVQEPIRSELEVVGSNQVDSGRIAENAANAAGIYVQYVVGVGLGDIEGCRVGARKITKRQPLGYSKPGRKDRRGPITWLNA